MVVLPSLAPFQAGQMTDIWGQQFDPPFFPLLRHNRALLTGFCGESPYTNPEQILCKKLKWAKVKTGHKWPFRSVKVWRMQFCCWEKNYDLSKWGGERGPSPPSPPNPEWNSIWLARLTVLSDILVISLSTLHCPYLVATIAELERCRNIDTIHRPPPTPQPPHHRRHQQLAQPRDSR